MPQMIVSMNLMTFNMVIITMWGLAVSHCKSTDMGFNVQRILDHTMFSVLLVDHIVEFSSVCQDQDTNLSSSSLSLCLNHLTFKETMAGFSSPAIVLTYHRIVQIVLSRPFLIIWFGSS